jgi:hypothetical protein
MASSHRPSTARFANRVSRRPGLGESELQHEIRNGDGARMDVGSGGLQGIRRTPSELCALNARQSRI